MKGLLLSVMIGLVVVSPAVSEAMEGQVGAKYTLACGRDYIASPWTQEDGYVNRAKDKLVFGTKNTLLGFMELYNEPRDAKREATGVIRGMGRGMVNMLGDTVGGALHLVTFPVTAVDVPLPEGGTDIL